MNSPNKNKIDSTINIDSVVKIKNEIKLLLEEIDDKEKIIVEKVTKNTQDIQLFKMYLENIIEEYHLVCKKIYN
jgi:hypothetical protein